MIANIEAKVSELAHVEAQEPGGVPLAAKAKPAPTEDTASVEPIGMAERAAAMEPKALASWVSGKVRHVSDMVPQDDSHEGEHAHNQV